MRKTMSDIRATAITLPASLLRDLKRVAADQGVTFSSVVRTFCAERLKDLGYLSVDVQPVTKGRTPTSPYRKRPQQPFEPYEPESE